MKSKNIHDDNSFLNDINLTLGCVLRGGVLSIKALHQTLREFAKQEGLKIVYMKVGNDKLYLTKQKPPHLELEEK